MRSSAGSAFRVSPRASAGSTPEHHDVSHRMITLAALDYTAHTREWTVRDSRIAEDTLAGATLQSLSAHARMVDAITPLCGATSATELFDCAAARPLHH